MPIGSFGIYPDMEEKDHRALEVNIPLFQVVYPKPIYFEEAIHGFFNVKVTSPDPEIRNSRHSIEWYSGGDAYIPFEIKNMKTGLAVAWVPDDPWMHNRIMFMTQPKVANMLKQLRRPDGNIISAAEIIFELKQMESVLMKPVKIWHVARNGKNECCFTKKDEAERYKETQGKTEIRLDPKTGTLQPLKVKSAEYSIVEGERLSWRPEISALIAREKNKHRFGWTEADEFKTKWRPKIIEAIGKQKEAFKAANDKIGAQDIASLAESLSEEQIELIAKRVMAKKKTKVEKEEEVAA